MSAHERFARIVSLVAELTRRNDMPDEAVAISEIVAKHGVTPDVIAADIRALTLLGDHADADWLLSLSIWQQGDQVAVSSRGPFRRPVRLSPEEQLAVQVALVMDAEGEALAKRLSDFWSGTTSSASAEPEQPPTTADIIRDAIHERQVLEIEYAGENDADVRTRVIHPYQLAEVGVRTYVVAFAEDVNAWRHFRLDRILTARPTAKRFDVRYDFEPIETRGEMFPGVRDSSNLVTVRFRPEAAPWAREYFTEHEARADGSVDVPFRATSEAWLTRRVLEFGTDAVVVDPPEYRDALRRAVA